MSNLKGKLSHLAARQPSGWKAKAHYRQKNRGWLKKSAAIAVQILDALKMQNISQESFAERTNISLQQMGKIVKGQENLTLEMISKMEVALGAQLVDICVEP